MVDSAPTDEEIAAAVAATGYRYTDPVTDPSASRISAVEPAKGPDAFPVECGDDPRGSGRPLRIRAADVAVDLQNYSVTAAARGWGAGWPSCGAVRSAGTAVVRADRSGVGVSVHRRIARLVDMLLDETERRGYLLRAGECGGYNCRAIAGTSTPSNHSWGLAVDINSAHNPYVRPRRTDMPAWMPPLWNRYGFAWGGNYSNNGTTGKADSMHYEFMGTPADADGLTALAMQELRDGISIGSSGKDDPVTAIPIAVQANGTFRISAMAEAGSSSVVVDRAWVTYGSTWGSTRFEVTALDGGGRVLAQEKFDMANNTARSMAVPSGSRLVTLEGSASAGAVPAAALVNKAR